MTTWVASIHEAAWHATSAIGAHLIAFCGHALRSPVHGRRSESPPEDHRSVCAACLHTIGYLEPSTPSPRPPQWPETDPDEDPEDVPDEVPTKRRRALKRALAALPDPPEEPATRSPPDALAA